MSPRLDDAPGRSLPAGIPCHPCQGRRFHEPVHEPGAGLRSDPAAAGPLPAAGRRDPLLRYPDHSRCHGPGPVLRDRRRPALPQGGLVAGRHRGAAGSRSGTGPGLCYGCRAHHPPRAERPRTADRLLRQPLDPRHLHGRGRLEQGLPQVQGDALRQPSGHARSAGQAGAIGDQLPQRADPRRRPGGADLRLMGRQLVGGGLPGVLPDLHAQDRRWIDPRARRTPGAGDPLHQGRRPVAGVDGRGRRRGAGPGLDLRHRQRPGPCR